MFRIDLQTQADESVLNEIKKLNGSAEIYCWLDSREKYWEKQKALISTLYVKAAGLQGEEV